MQNAATLMSRHQQQGQVWLNVPCLVSTNMRCLVYLDHVISSIVHKLLQALSKLVAQFAAPAVSAHVGANEESKTIKVPTTALHRIYSQCRKLTNMVSAKAS